MKEAKYSIRDLEKLSGIKAHTLRIWEKRYGILSPERTTTNIRYYTDADLRKILNVALLNRQGFKISVLSRLTDEALSEKVLSVTQNDTLHDLHTETLLSAMIELDENKFEKTINKIIINVGFEETLSRTIYPLFEKIGVLWQTNSINAAQEHFISNLIRQKIMVAIDGLTGLPAANSKSFFLFLREGEWHELGLMVYHYFIRKAGHKVIYFGQSVPLLSLTDTTSVYDPDYLLTILTCSLHQQDFHEYINQLSQSFPQKPIYIGGIQHTETTEPLPDNVIALSSIEDFRSYLLNLN